MAYKRCIAHHYLATLIDITRIRLKVIYPLKILNMISNLAQIHHATVDHF
jgi:hypothetical protein